MIDAGKGSYLRACVQKPQVTEDTSLQPTSIQKCIFTTGREENESAGPLKVPPNGQGYLGGRTSNLKQKWHKRLQESIGGMLGIGCAIVEP